MTIYVVNVSLQLDKVPLNVYGSFGHTPAITFWCDDNYGYQFRQKYLYHIVGTHLTMIFWSEPETGNNEIYVYACVLCIIDER